MTYYLNHSEWMNSVHVPEGMNLDMINMTNRLDTLLKPGLKDECNGKIVVDLGAGTGVLGLYALEQGAKFVYFVERDPQMFYILENVLSKKLKDTQYKLIHSDIENLDKEQFDCGLPEVVVSEFYGPRLFDEGYVNYTKHIRSLSPKCVFIPETFLVDFYFSDIDLSQPIWPHDSSLIDHFKFMYKDKGFAKSIFFSRSANPIGSIEFNANTQVFNNNVDFKYTIDKEQLLIGSATVVHKQYKQYYTTFGWYMDHTDLDKEFIVYYDVDAYFNPRKKVKC